MAATTLKPISGFLDFSESYSADGRITSVLLGLPPGHRCRITEQADGSFQRVTQNASKHGRRYDSFNTYEAALAASVKWGRRKVREALTALMAG